MATYYCSGCKEPCNGHVVDEGLGSYEFWGQEEVDTKKAFLSDCCEEAALDEKGNVITLAQLQFEFECEQADYLRSQEHNEE